MLAAALGVSCADVIGARFDEAHLAPAGRDAAAGATRGDSAGGTSGRGGTGGTAPDGSAGTVVAGAGAQPDAQPDVTAGGGGFDASDDVGAPEAEASTPPCVGGSTEDCYTGPAGTRDVGPCKGGRRTCEPGGTAWGPCEGEVTPTPEDPATLADESCDGLTGNGLAIAQFGGASAQYVRALAVDGPGNAYVAGAFHGTLVIGSTSHASSGNADLWVAKLDSNLTPLWSKSWGSTELDTVEGLAVDGGGNVYVTGEFDGTIDFGDGPLVPADSTLDVFVLKLSADGDVLWSRGYGGPGADHAYDIAVDPSGNAYVTGEFDGPVQFGATAVLPGTGSNDGFVVKLDPAGTPLWRLGFGGPGAQIGAGVAARADGSVIVTAGVAGLVSFGGPPVGSAGSTAVAAELDAAGAHLWSRTIAPLDSVYEVAKPSTTPAGALVATTYRGTASLDGTTHQSAGLDDILVAMLDGGGARGWSRSFGDAADEQSPRRTAVDPDGFALVGGTFVGSLDCGRGSVATAGLEDVFVMKLDARGDPRWCWIVGDAGAQELDGVATDASGNVYVAGSFTSTVNFGSGTLAASSYDGFVAKLAP